MKNAQTVLLTAVSTQIRKNCTPITLKPLAAVLLATGLASPAHAIDTLWLAVWAIGE